jgi:hypothetical protein
MAIGTRRCDPLSALDLDRKNKQGKKIKPWGFYPEWLNFKRLFLPRNSTMRAPLLFFLI